MEEHTSALRTRAIASITATIDSLEPKKQRTLSYWLCDYARFLGKEKEFNPQKLVTYKRGAIVKVHLGFRIGSEEGGLHYAVVIDHNAKSSPVATVIPLTSVKSNTDIANLHPSRVYLGDEIYQRLKEKLDESQAEICSIQEKLVARLNSIRTADKDICDDKAAVEERRISMDALRKTLIELKEKQKNVRKMADEISKMKHGSIALVSQITTVSKIRIYDPLFPGDVLSNIRLSDESMEKLDKKVISLFTK